MLDRVVIYDFGIRAPYVAVIHMDKIAVINIDFKRRNAYALIIDDGVGSDIIILMRSVDIVSQSNSIRTHILVLNSAVAVTVIRSRLSY